MENDELEKHVREHENPPAGTGAAPGTDPNAAKDPQQPMVPPAPAEEVARAPGVPEQGAQAARAALGRKPGATKDDVNAPVRHDRDQPFGAEKPSDADLEKELTQKVEAVRADRAGGGDKGVSKGARQPMLAGVMDKETGSVFTAGNRNAIPEVLHPLMEERLKAETQVFDSYKKLTPAERTAVQSMKPEEMKKFLEEHKIPETAGGISSADMLKLTDSRMRFKEQQVKGDKKLSDEQKQKALNDMWAGARREIGTHGEFNALNAALLATGNKDFKPEDLGRFLLHNTYSDPKGTDKAGAMQRCHFCEVLTGGVGLSGDLAKADAERDKHER